MGGGRGRLYWGLGVGREMGGENRGAAKEGGFTEVGGRGEKGARRGDERVQGAGGLKGGKWVGLH